MLTKENIKNSLKLNAPLLKRFQVKRIGLFGSYVNGSQREDSDIDLIVEFANAINLFEYVHLSDSIGELFHKEIDLVTVEGIKPLIKERIMNEVEWVERL